MTDQLEMSFEDFFYGFCEIQYNQTYYLKSEMQPSSQLISHLDYLSQDSIVRKNKSSYLGIIATIILIIISLSLYIPLAISYSQGIYSGATFFTRNNINLGQKFYSKDDFKLAIVFKDRNSGMPINHSKLLSTSRAKIIHKTSTYGDVQTQQLILCDRQYFEGDIQGELVIDCLKVPDYIEYKALSLSSSVFSFLSIQIKQKTNVAFPFRAQDPQKLNSLLTSQQIDYKKILQNYYYQILFSTKIITRDGSIKFRMNKISSTQFNVGSDSLGASFNIVLNIRQNLIDTSIIPWRNDKNITFLDWSGEVFKGKSVSFSQALTSGVDGKISLQHDILTSYHSYKKLDWLIGIISGGIFLLYIMIWLPLTYINNGLQKIQIANKLLLQKTQEDPETQDALIQVKIPKLYLLKRLIPFCKDIKYEKIIQEVQNQNDVCLLIKKMKVAVRNLKKKEFQQQFQAKIVVFQEQQRLIKEQSQHEQSSVVSHRSQVIQTISQGVKFNKKRILEQSKENLQQETQFGQTKLKKLQNQAQFMEQEERNEQESSNNDKIEIEARKNEHLRSSANKLMQNQRLFQQQYQNSGNKNQFHDKNEIHLISNQQTKLNQFKIRQQQVPHGKDTAKLPLKDKQVQKIDPKIGLTLNQLHHIKKNPYLEIYLQNNPTYLILKQEKHDNFQQIMELQKYDKWKGYLPKKNHFIRQKIASFIQFFDMFGAKYQFISQPQNGTIFGSVIVLIIFGLSILTFLSTLININKPEYIKQAYYLQPNDINFTKTTSMTFNMLACFYSPWLLSNVKLTFFTYDNGITRQIVPIPLGSTENYLDITNIQKLFENYFWTSDCFRFPDNITINMNQNAYFGYKITPLCTGTQTFCQANRNASIINFLKAINNNRKTLVLPSYNFDPKQQKLFNSATNTSFQITHFINMTQFDNYEQNVEVHQTKVYDDTENLLFSNGPKLIDENLNADYSIRRTRFKNIQDNQTQYVMKINLGPTLNKITIKDANIDYIFGIFGGILLFWYVIIQFIAKCYSRFCFYLYVSKIVYEEQGYDDSFIKKFIAMSFWPRVLISKCTKSREDIIRMRFMTHKIEDSISHLSILKYTQICYKLSSAFFSSLPAKHMSLIYFREKIDQSAQVQNPLQPTKKETKQQDFVDQQTLPLLQQKPTIIANQIMNDSINNQQIQQYQIKNQEKERLEALKKKQQNEIRMLRQQEDDHIIEKYQSKWTDYFDVFKQNATFYFQKKDKSTSVCGGLLSIITIVFIILLAYYQLTSYFKRYQRISSDIVMDISNQGLTLVTGKNFKIAVNFLNKQTLIPVDVSKLLTNIGIAIRKQKFQRINGKVVSSISTIPFVVCPNNYLQSWMSKTVDISYYKGLKYSYCVPDNQALHLQGQPSDNLKHSFKFTIYNQVPTVSGVSKLNDFLNLHHVQLHFSSPQQNSIKRTINYQINSQILAYFGPNNPLRPFQTNITLSKLNITYDEGINWQNVDNTISYLYEPYNKQILDYRYNSNSLTNSWYNVSFSYTKKMHTYLVKEPKFIQVFGIIGGITIIFVLIFGCLAISYNRYKMKYKISSELYLFDKLRIIHQKQKIKKLGKKSDFQRKEIQKINNFSQFNILQAYILSYFGYIMKDFNFNKNLRRMTLLQEKVAKDLNLANFYFDLYKTRNIIHQQINNKFKLDFKLTDVFLKKIINTSPIPYNMDALKNYARQHRLSSYEQYIVMKAIQSGVKIRQILDSRILEKLFNFIDDGVSINLNRLSDTYNSMQSSAQNRSQIQNDA